MLPISRNKGGHHRFNPNCVELDVGIHKFLDAGTIILGNTRILTDDAQNSPWALAQIPPFLSHIGYKIHPLPWSWL
jgi:hypothetical protein